MLIDNKLYTNYEIFADIFKYPNGQLKNDIENVQNILNDNYIDAAEQFQVFTNFSKSVELKTWEEIYTRSFDVQALTTLDLGYVLFGDDYKRGELLVNLNNEHKKVNNSCGSELSDHLPNILRLLVKMADEELRNDIISLILYPALRKIETEFNIKQIEKKENVYRKHHRTIISKNNSHGLVYHSTILALLMMIEKDFPHLIVKSKLNKKNSNPIENELEIEKLG